MVVGVQRVSLERAELQLIVKDPFRVNVVPQSGELLVQVQYLLQRHIRPVDVPHYILDHHFVLSTFDIPVTPRGKGIYNLIFTLDTQVLVL